MTDEKVHLFADLANPVEDTKLAGQTPGGGASPSNFQLSLAAIRTLFGTSGLRRGKVETQTATANVEKQISIPAGSVVSKIILKSTATGSVNIGSTSGGTDISESEPYYNGNQVMQPNTYFETSGTLYFSGHTHALTIKIIIDYA